MNEMKQTAWEQENEIDLVQLLVDVLNHIKPILLCAFAVALLAGGVKLPAALRSSRAASAPQQETTTESEAVATPEQELYQSQLKQVKELLEQTQEQIEQLETEKQKSALLSMDAEHFCQCDAAWYVDTHYQVMPGQMAQNPDPTGKVVAAYCALMSSGDFCDFLLTRVSADINAQWLGELVTVNADESAAALLSLTVIAPDAQTADELLAAAKEYVETNKAQIDRTIAAHDLTLIQKWSGDGTAEQMKRILDARNSYATRLLSLQNQKIAQQNQMAALQAAIRTQTQSAASAATTAVESAVGKQDVVKYALIGFLLGGVLAALWFAIRFIARDPFVSEEVLHKRCGLLVLASVRRFEGRSPWQRMLSRLCGDAKRVDTLEDAAALARANVASLLGVSGHKDEKVLLVGHEPERFALLAGDETERYLPGGNILSDKDAVEKLREYENVMLVERKGAVSHREIARELERLLLLNKNVVGMIAL